MLHCKGKLIQIKETNKKELHSITPRVKLSHLIHIVNFILDFYDAIAVPLPNNNWMNSFSSGNFSIMFKVIVRTI